MNKLIQPLTKLGVIIVFFLISGNIVAQQWVTDMQDTSLSLNQKTESFNAYWENHQYEKGKGYKQFKRKEYFLKNRVGNNGKFNPKVDRISDYKKAQQQMATKSLGAAGKWIQLGPFGPTNGMGSGRINCIDYHPTNANKIIIGAPSGGIWRTDNSGQTWTTNTDDLASIGFSDIKYAPSNGNIIYAATGDIDGDDTYSHGILKSTDGGQTWNVTSWAYDYTSQRKTYRILIHPTNPDIVYATTNLGFFKTIDGGTIWTRARVGVYKDIEFKPNDPNTIYLAAASSIFMTTDAGATYSNIKSISGSSRIELATTNDDPNYIYAISSSSADQGFNGIYLSTDAGSTFNLKASSPNILGWKKNGTDSGGQGWYDLSIEASPSNKNKIFVGGINMWTSNDAGANWSLAAFWMGGTYPYIHADIHMIKYSPHGTTTLWACTDGGVSLSSDNGTTWDEKNTGLSVAQMYRLGGSKTIANKIMTGWQDNGSSLMTTSWNQILGGDGMECIISHSDPMTIYASIYNGSLHRSYDGGSSFSSISESINETGAWLTPYIMDDNNANLLLAGYTNVWKSENKGNSWTKISSWSTSTLDAIASAGTNSSNIWAANIGAMYKTTDGGSNWTQITADIGGGQVNYIAINKANPNKVWVCKSGFNDGEKVYQTTNGGTTWTNISGTLPNYPVNTIINAPNTADGLYIGTDIGVYYYDSNLGDWIPFMKDLPNVVVKELELFEQDNKIRAATYGRGLWESVTYPFANSIQNDENTKVFDINIYPNPAKNVIYIDFLSETPNNYNLKIFNNLGSVVNGNNILNKSSNAINISNLPNGIYFIKISNNTQQSVHKFVIN